MHASAAPRIFVSHSHEDDTYCRAYVDELRRLLGSERDGVWYDEHNLGSGELLREIQRQLHARPIFVVILSQAALRRSKWVADECSWAYDLYRAEPNRTILPVTGGQIAENDFIPDWIYLRGFRRVEAPGLLPFPPAEAARRTATTLGVAPPPASGGGTPKGTEPAHTATPPPPRSAQAAAQAPLFAHREGSGVRNPLSPRLANLGYTAYISPDGTEYILPPVCDVPAWEFMMGSDPRQDPQVRRAEQPQHPVTLPAFQIARFPVTVAEYACFVRAGHREPPKGWAGTDWRTQLTRLDHPVTCVSWYDARDYAAWLAERTGERRWRLPSEAEWEKAARFDPAHPRSARIYPWGDRFDAARCNTREGSKGTATPVGSCPDGASPCGAQDLAGNVWEWTRTIWDPQAYSKKALREDDDSTENRALRGGSWGTDSTDARAAFRVSNQPGGVNDFSGFRLALSAAPSSAPF